MNGLVNHMWAYWVPMLVFESISIVLAVNKSVKIVRTSGGPPQVLTVLFRDSVLYFGGILAIVVANVAICSTAQVRPRFSLTCSAKLRSKPVTAIACPHHNWVSAVPAFASVPIGNKADLNGRPAIAAPSILGCRMLVCASL